MIYCLKTRNTAMHIQNAFTETVRCDLHQTYNGVLWE